MADDLVARLRGYLEWREDWPSKEIPLVIDRIEQLEALIALIEDLDPNVMDEARAALEGRDG